jgi:uncharacterized Fe-S radical SAM superfamily protein PflX
MESSYLAASRSGLLDRRINKSLRLLEECSLCPRRCNVDRLAGKIGLCRTGALAENCDDKELKTVFQDLDAMERNHKLKMEKIFVDVAYPEVW